MNTSEFLKIIFNFLNKNVEYVVLRNYEGLPYHNKSRDIDIAIQSKDFITIKSALIRLINQCDWKIVTNLKSDRLITWVCGIVREDQSIDVVQFDFFYHTSLYGLVLLENKDILSTRVFNGELYHPNKTFEFLDKYMYDRAVGAKYPEKYQKTRVAVENDPKMLHIIKEVFGAQSLVECDRMSKAQILQSTIKYNIKRYGLLCIPHYLNFEYHHIKNYICSNTGFSIGFTGPDGSGKTTVIDLLIRNLGDVFKKAHTYYHFRPLIFGNISDVAHSAGLKKEVDKNYDQPHRGSKTGVLSSFLRLLYYSVDYILGYFLKVKTIIRITRLVIFDRYFTDIICDSRRSRIYLSPKFLYYWKKLFIPSLDYNILLTAKTDTILSRKKELDKEGINAINEKINYLAKKKGYIKILNETIPQDAVAQILTYVFEEQNKKNLKKLR